MTNHAVPISLRARVQLVGLLAGPLLAAIVVALLPESYESQAGDTASFTFAGRATLGLMVWMGTWWLTEAIHVSATALLPIVVLPLVTVDGFGRTSDAVSAATTPYAHPLIGLFLGGFMIALAMERWGLHRRIALYSLRVVGTRPRAMVAGFMAVTAVLSMWVSNTATTAMMLPITLSVTALVSGREDISEASRHRFQLCLLLGIAYAASIGGIGTLIGTPPNVFLAGFLQETYGREISFAGWMLVGMPLVVVFIPITWWMLTSVIYPIRLPPLAGGRALMRSEIAKLGRPSRGEWATFAVFVITAIAWMTRRWLTTIEIGGHQPLAGLSDAGIAVLAGLALFVIPVRLRDRVFVLDWATARRLPWGVLLLFGGGLSLATAVQTHGVAEFIGAQTRMLAGMPTLLIVVIIVAGVIFLTELTSNTATTAALLPLLAGIAPVLGIDPILLLVPAAVAASCAFMMPVATPPNAIVFGSGDITIPEMCRAGLWLNLIGIVLVTILAYTIAVPILGAVH